MEFQWYKKFLFAKSCKIPEDRKFNWKCKILRMIFLTIEINIFCKRHDREKMQMQKWIMDKFPMLFWFLLQCVDILQECTAWCKFGKPYLDNKSDQLLRIILGFTYVKKSFDTPPIQLWLFFFFLLSQTVDWYIISIMSKR